MKIKCDILKHKFVAVLLYTLITGCFYLFLFYRYTLIYGINDDWMMYAVLSGSYTGKPSPYVIYISYPLALLLSGLYRITYQIPWYGLFLHGCYALCALYVFMRFYERIEGKFRKIIVSGLVLSVYWISNLQILIALQYTHVAGMCGAAAIFMFLTSDIKNTDWKQGLVRNIPTFILVVLSVCIRQNAAFMCLPVAGMIVVAKYVLEEKKISVNGLKKYGAFAASICALVGGILLCHTIAYSSDEWSEYIKINNHLTDVVDYYGDIDYEEMKDVANQIGMTKDEYDIRQLMLNFYNADIPYSEFYEVMAERSKEIYDELHPFKEKLQTANKQIKDTLTDCLIWPQNGFVILLFILTAAMTLFGKTLSGVILLGCFLFGRFFAWYYLLLNGRFPLRIPQCLFSIDILVLLGILLYCGFLEQYENDFIWLRRGIFVIVLGAGLVTGYKGIEYSDVNFSYISIYQDRWYGIKEYCNEHPENMYLLNGGSQTLYYFADDILENETIGPLQNYYSPSNFYSICPNFYVKTGYEPGGDNAKAMLEQGNLLWIYEKGMFSEESLLVHYFSNRYESFSYELVDTFDTETSSFEVYQMKK